ncbi:MAG: hypothetical protein IT233_10720 [Bacteroidia bacterium]|nr:hypothetical protein [Bacteroidia bacterium]
MKPRYRGVFNFSESPESLLSWSWRKIENSAALHLTVTMGVIGLMPVIPLSAQKDCPIKKGGQSFLIFAFSTAKMGNGLKN